MYKDHTTDLPLCASYREGGVRRGHGFRSLRLSASLPILLDIFAAATTTPWVAFGVHDDKTIHDSGWRGMDIREGYHFPLAFRDCIITRQTHRRGTGNSLPIHFLATKSHQSKRKTSAPNLFL
jgi:hypothetical protein